VARLTWNDVGDRFFETGVDHGVLYLANEIGVPWTGLISVSENPSGGEAKPYYYDGIKYANIAASEEFEATLEAFGCPVEFYPCEGTVAIQNGLFATQQPRKAFGLSYRTLIGSDVAGTDAGYKIHVVYNALAAPAQKTHTTISADATEPSKFSWDITALPPILTGLRPTSHFVIDTRYTDSVLLANLEGLLYGSEVNDPYLPTAQEIYDLFTT
jgi:hypothetical protein